MKKILFIGLFSLLSILSARAYDFEVDGIYYDILSGTTGEVEVTYKGFGDGRYSGSVVIPATVTYEGVTYRVTSIGESAFGYCSGLTSVTIPESVTSIGEEAFFSCSGLTSVTIPEGVTSVGHHAFYGCRGLTSVAWNAVDCYNKTDYYSSPFAETSLTTITFGSEVEHIPDYLCCGCSGLTSVTIPNSVTSIGDAAFENCSGLTSVTIPNSVISIGNSAFYLCSSLTSVTIPESVTSIGNEAFVGCSSISSPLYNSKIFAYLPNSYSGEYTIPSGIQSIAGGAFYACTGLRSVTIPESVLTIGKYAFEACTGLGTVTVPEGVIYIGESAFSNCYALTSITLPKSLEIISPYAFSECGSLASVTSLATTPPRISYYNGEDYEVSTDPVFYVYLGTLYVPRGCKVAYESAPEWYKFAKIEETSGVGTAAVKVQVNDTTRGSVIGGGEWEYALDEQVTLVAVPYPGYYFIKWDDGKTSNPRILTVEGDLTLTAIFAKPGGTTANEETLAAAPFAYVQGRTAYLSDGLGEVEAFTVTGQRVYRGFDRSVTLPHPGVYILRVVADGRRCKVAVR